MEYIDKETWLKEEEEKRKAQGVMNATWVIVDEHGKVLNHYDSEGKPMNLKTVKGSRRFDEGVFIRKGIDNCGCSNAVYKLNQLHLSLYVNVAGSEEEMKQRLKEYQDDTRDIIQEIFDKCPTVENEK